MAQLTTANPLTSEGIFINTAVQTGSKNVWYF